MLAFLQVNNFTLPGVRRGEAGNLEEKARGEKFFIWNRCNPLKSPDWDE